MSIAVPSQACVSHRGIQSDTNASTGRITATVHDTTTVFLRFRSGGITVFTLFNAQFVSVSSSCHMPLRDPPTPPPAQERENRVKRKQSKTVLWVMYSCHSILPQCVLFSQATSPGLFCVQARAGPGVTRPPAFELCPRFLHPNDQEYHMGAEEIARPETRGGGGEGEEEVENGSKPSSKTRILVVKVDLDNVRMPAPHNARAWFSTTPP